MTNNWTSGSPRGDRLARRLTQPDPTWTPSPVIEVRPLKAFWEDEVIDGRYVNAVIHDSDPEKYLSVDARHFVGIASPFQRHLAVRHKSNWYVVTHGFLSGRAVIAGEQETDDDGIVTNVANFRAFTEDVPILVRLRDPYLNLKSGTEITVSTAYSGFHPIGSVTTAYADIIGMKGEIATGVWGGSSSISGASYNFTKSFWDLGSGQGVIGIFRNGSYLVIAAACG